jgi:hypothetical protein
MVVEYRLPSAKLPSGDKSVKIDIQILNYMMKKFYLYLVLATGIFSCLFPACKKMDATYKNFVVPAGITYPGKANSLVAHSGINRIQLSWLRGTDPKVVKARIFWNNFTDSVEVAIAANQDVINYTIENLPENTYSFIVKTYDIKGNVSIPVEAIGTSYGESYKKTLLNISVSKTTVSVGDSLAITWGAADITNGAIATEVRYQDATGNTVVVRTSIDKPTTAIPNFAGPTFEYRTIFLPNSFAIDTCYTAYMAYNDNYLLLKKGMTITADCFEPKAQLPNGSPTFLLDDNLETYWHSQQIATLKYPHWLAVDLQRAVFIQKVVLNARTSNFSNNFNAFTIQKSTDGLNWVDCQAYTFGTATGPQTFTLTAPVTTRYIRFYLTKGPQYYAHLAEITIWGY